MNRTISKGQGNQRILRQRNGEGYCIFELLSIFFKACSQYNRLFFLHDLLNCKDEFNSFDDEEIVDDLLANANMIHMTVNQVCLFKWSLLCKQIPS